MSEINNHAGGGKSHKKVKRNTIKLDMTPMVDLAFLLLTFFILATTLSKPSAIPLVMPEKANDGQPGNVKAENALNLVLGGKNKVFWYLGQDSEKAKAVDYSVNGIRKVLLENRQNRKLFVLIKPSDASNYQNLVDILDEMTIASIQRYSIAEVSSADHKLIGTFN